MPELLVATRIGARAAEALARGSILIVRGITSRGVYLYAAPQTIVFLTRDPTPGPFSVNIAGFPAEFDRLASGDRVIFAADRLVLGSEGLAISMAGAPEWRTPPPPDHPLMPEQRMQNLTAIARRVLEAKGWVGLAGLLFELLQLEMPEPPERDPLGMRETLAGIRTELSNANSARLIDTLGHALGRGPGLTPSGDDLIAGVLLGLQRSRAIPFSGVQIEMLNLSMINAAYKKTTTYSANLIEAAAAGEADERVHKACDAVFTGIPDPAEAAAAISHWGSSSGIDTLTGIALVALASQSIPPYPSQETP